MRLQGVLYSHRSNFLHALMASSTDIKNLSSTSCFCALVPMFHANAWALVFAAPLTGARLVLPGVLWPCQAQQCASAVRGKYACAELLLLCNTMLVHACVVEVHASTSKSVSATYGW